MNSTNPLDRRIEKINRSLIQTKPQNPGLREDQFFKLISKIGQIEPELSAGKVIAQNGQVAVSKELLVEAMREFLTTCVSCELLLTSVFGEALDLEPKESYKLTLSEIETTVQRWPKLPTRQDYVKNALELVSEVSVFHSFVILPHRDLNYNHQRATDSSGKALGRLMKLIFSSGHSVAEIIDGAVSNSNSPKSAITSKKVKK